MTRYLLNVLIGVDQLGNAIAGGNPDETISSRIGRGASDGRRWAIVLEAAIDLLFAAIAGQRQHCSRSIEPKI